ncbi:hypothetical protein SAMN05216249_102226 [Acetitomaculum ruminis DSM 5522]|uniref:DUF4829 domain-containing protein n=1 Tax=Acetitomaculum ruminis DSM 5522 TaxID=1120918 RepID=A0A1I0VVQ0_9FIRM|nr:hypothetical protein [Acetitomaculum ruminis]SFA80422.1 hypothetical protein SAMN05216249_102226 [Acetitomaculum ruminis DSM 5522]
MKNKFIIAICAIALSFSIVSCGNSSNAEKKSVSTVTENEKTDKIADNNADEKLITEATKEQKEVIDAFFKCFEVKDYEGMKKYCSDSMLEKEYFHENDVFGMATAKINSYDKGEDAVIYDKDYDEYWIGVNLDVETVEDSALYPDTSTYLYVTVKLIVNEWKITGFTTG